jgi:hypothetical protein
MRSFIAAENRVPLEEIYVVRFAFVLLRQVNSILAAASLTSSPPSAYIHLDKQAYSNHLHLSQQVSLW